MSARMADPDIARYYELSDEHRRLRNAFGQLEFQRSMELLLRYLPPPPARVLDIGGGTGPYSEQLGQRGYETYLLDFMEKHVEVARTRAGITSAVAGDARKLHWPDKFAEAVLLMGPLYHLTELKDRLAALREARRVLKPGGLLAAAAISRFASLIDGLARGFIFDPRFQPILLHDLDSGNHFNATDEIEFFTTAHFHLPDEIVGEIREAGFEDAQVFAVEGPLFCTDLEKIWSDNEKREFMLSVLRKVERQPSILGVSPHLLVFARAV
jgi:ubiquinone/menaquinone biosynthesis C-methylase UbiE